MAYVGNEPSVNFTSFAKQDITGDGTANYTLTHAVANANEIEVFVNNVRQEPTDAYSVNGTALTMTGNVASSDNFYVVYLGKAIQTTVPPDGSVSTAKIANSAVDLTSKVTGVLPVSNSQTNTPAFLARMSGNQNVSDEVKTKVEFDTEVYDTDGKFDHTTYRFTPTVAGTYFFYAQVNGQSNNNTELADMFLILRKNNSDLYLNRTNFTANYVNQTTLSISATDVANTTDYYEIMVFINDTSGNPTIASLEPLSPSVADGFASYFGAYKLIGV